MKIFLDKNLFIKYSIKKKILDFIDLEGIVIMDRGVTTTISQINGEIIRRRSLKIKDETGVLFITVWNNKVNK